MLNIIKLTSYPVMVRFNFSFGNSEVVRYITHVLRYFRTLHIVLSLVKHRVTRRLTRIQTMFNPLKYHKTVSNDLVRLRFISCL